MIGSLAAQLAYTAVCLGVIGAIFHFQSYRHRYSRGVVWYGYSLLALGAAWEIADCWIFGPPGFPSSRWVIMPALAIVLGFAAARDWMDQRLVVVIERDARAVKSAGANP